MIISTCLHPFNNQQTCLFFSGVPSICGEDEVRAISPPLYSESLTLVCAPSKALLMASPAIFPLHFSVKHWVFIDLRLRMEFTTVLLLLTSNIGSATIPILRSHLNVLAMRKPLSSISRFRNIAEFFSRSAPFVSLVCSAVRASLNVEYSMERMTTIIPSYH